MQVLDISNWMINDEYQLSGTRKKHWVVNPMDEKEFIFKIPRVNGELWAEIVAFKIGEALGLKMSNYNIALRNGQLGVLSTNFVNKDVETFYEGGDLFEAKFPSFNRYRLHNYTLENIVDILKEFYLDEEFVAIPFFDALIGNQDRHCDNWGLIIKGNRSFLAPIYDNGTS
ncbi:MAG: HipA domain-containing protein, partial [Thermicanus sp.]|nr:HipA domain-containing protein [Thermicanus sp.]